MRFATALGLGYRRTRRHAALALVPYALALLPALGLAALASPGLADALDHSLFARRAMGEESFAVWHELTRVPTVQQPPLTTAALVLWLAVALAGIVAAGGLVESLLERTARGGAPFAVGCVRHLGRFLRAALTHALALLVAFGLFAAAAAALEGQLPKLDGRLVLALRWVELAAAGLVLLPFGLAYDLSRIAAASHGGRSMVRGYLRALGHVLRNLPALVPLYLMPAGAGVVLFGGFLAAAARFTAASLPQVLLLFAAQQLVLLSLAALKLWLLASEVSYFQAIGEPGWAGYRLETPRHQ